MVGKFGLRRRSLTQAYEKIPSSDGKDAPQRTRGTSTSKRLVVILTVVLVLFIAAFVYDYQTSFPATTLHLQDQRPLPLSRPLFPENHTTRRPSTQYHQWRLTAEYRYPDGAQKLVYLINGQFPGPTIEVRSGDTLVVEVENALEEEGVAIHWHGLHMRDANEQDGAVGFTQCPIPPKQNFTYEFKISPGQHGTFWYHAHDQVQRADGLYGGLIVHDPNQNVIEVRQYDEERLLLVGDFYHRPANDVLAWYMRHASFGNEPVPESLVVNGVGAYNCHQVAAARPVECLQILEAERPYMEFDVTKRYRFRFVNVGTLAGINLTFSSSNFETTVFEMDGGHEIQPQMTSSVGLLYPGERVDFITRWIGTKEHASPFLEFELDGESFKYPSPSLMAYHRFPIRLTGEVDGYVESATPQNSVQSFSLVQSEAAQTVDPALFPEKANTTMVVYTTSMKLARLKNIPHGFMNRTTWKPQKVPLVTQARSQWDEHQLVPYIPYDPINPIWVDLVINNMDDGSHPFHLHGMDFYVLASCVDGTWWGSFNPFDAPDGPPCGPYNTVNPAKRDTVFVPRRGYTVIRFRADNPGIWMFHCHILWHQASGMAMGFQVGGDDEHAVALTWEHSRRDTAMKFCPQSHLLARRRTIRSA